MAIDPAEVRRIARLAHLELDADTVRSLSRELQTILEEGGDLRRMRRFLWSEGRRRSLHFAGEPSALRSMERIRVQGLELPPVSGSDAGAVVATRCPRLAARNASSR